MDEKSKRCNVISNEVGTSNWLTALPMREYKYILNKQQFWDSIRLRYGWPVPGLPQNVLAVKTSMFNNPCHARKADL